MKTIIAIACMVLLYSLNLVAQTKESGMIFSPDGSIRFSDETIHLFADSAYRAEVYQDTYQIEQVPQLLEANDLLRALWVLINVFPQDNKQAGTIAAILAQKGIRGQHYLEAFYTYVFADPHIIQITERNSYLKDPILLEKKLEDCKTLVVFTEKWLKSNDQMKDPITSSSK